MLSQSSPKNSFFNAIARPGLGLIFFLVIIFALPKHSRGQNQPGFLKVCYDSVAVKVYLNQKMLGYTPLPATPLAPGSYQLTVAHPNPFIWGNWDWQDSIRIVAGDTLVIHPQFKRSLQIRTRPFDAKIFMNQKLLGRSPLTLLLNSEINQQLLIKKNGYQDTLINLGTLSHNFLNVKLVPDESVLKLRQLRQPKDIKHRYKKLTYGLWGLAVLSGFSSVYLKTQADANYKKYLTAGSLHDMNRYYNNALKYDRYTNISLGLVQACFILSFYFMMH